MMMFEPVLGLIGHPWSGHFTLIEEVATLSKSCCIYCGLLLIGTSMCLLSFSWKFVKLLSYLHDSDAAFHVPST